MKFSGDGQYMASGDRVGNLRLLLCLIVRVHSLKNFSLLAYHEAHEAEVLTLNFTQPSPECKRPHMLASASRDRILHVFDVRNNFQLLQTLDDHSSSITSAFFTEDGGRLISCGPDKSIIFRSCQDNSPLPYFTSYQLHSDRLNIYELDIDTLHNRILAVTQDRKVNIFDIATGKLFKSIAPPSAEDQSAMEGSLIHISLDPSLTFVVTAGTDKRVRLHDLDNGNCIASVGGHSEMITSVRFTEDCQRVISTSGDGCIFVWKLDKQFSKVLLSRKAKMLLLKEKSIQHEVKTEEVKTEEPKIEENGEDQILQGVRRNVRDILRAKLTTPVIPTINLSEITNDTESITINVTESDMDSYDVDGAELPDDESESAVSDPQSEPEPVEIDTSAKDKLRFRVTMTPIQFQKVLGQEEEHEDSKNSKDTEMEPAEKRDILNDMTDFDEYLTKPATFTPNRNSITAAFLMTVKGKERNSVSTSRRRRSITSIVPSVIAEKEEYSFTKLQERFSGIQGTKSPQILSSSPESNVDYKALARDKLMGGSKIGRQKRAMSIGAEAERPKFNSLKDAPPLPRVPRGRRSRDSLDLKREELKKFSEDEEKHRRSLHKVAEDKKVPPPEPPKDPSKELLEKVKEAKANVTLLLEEFSQLSKETENTSYKESLELVHAELVLLLRNISLHASGGNVIMTSQSISRSNSLKDRISLELPPEALEAETSETETAEEEETNLLLEKYSDLLVAMVERKLQKL